MSSLATRAVWCLQCGAPPEVAITVERNGVLGHYGACGDHIETVCRRVRTDAERITKVDKLPSATADAQRAELEAMRATVRFVPGRDEAEVIDVEESDGLA